MNLGIVTGIPGVGKTTVLGEVEKLSKEKNIEVLIMNYGNYMLNTAINMGFVKDRDEIRKLPLTSQKKLQYEAATNIIHDASKLEDKGIALLDTHAIIKTPSGYWPGLPKHVIEILNPKVIFLIESEPEVILNRQKGDSTRKRADYNDIEVIKESISFARYAAMASAVLVGASVKIIKNEEGTPSKAAEEILNVMIG
ncbi:adenylate kinase [Sulfolobales archaeon HS-7]|nr:adenylate kinase [Sulfolobales archaeon HS-7]